MLFDEIKRMPLEPTERLLPTFELLNRFDWYGSSQLRIALEGWYSRYPSDGRSDLRSRFRSKDNRNHDGALFELACHEILLRLGFKLEIHPSIPESNNHPDFLARGDDKEFYVEATATGNRDGPFTLSANEQTVINDLNTLTSDDFCIGIEVEGELKRTLPRSRIMSVFRELLNAFTREEVSNTISKGRTYDAPSKTITEGDWTLQGWLVPIPDSESVMRRSQIVIYPFTAAYTDVVGSVRNSLDRKRNRYGELSAPLVIAVSVRDSFYNGPDNDLDVLQGSQAISYPAGDVGASGTLIRKQNGIWYRSHKVDAVLLCRFFDVWNLRNAAGCLYIDPRSNKADFPNAMLRAPHAVTDETGTKWFEGIDFAQLLGRDASGMFD